jgi:hypothetical protein
LASLGIRKKESPKQLQNLLAKLQNPHFVVYVDGYRNQNPVIQVLFLESLGFCDATSSRRVATRDVQKSQAAAAAAAQPLLLRAFGAAGGLLPEILATSSCSTCCVAWPCCSYGATARRESFNDASSNC